jgi:hypothetical protein
MKVLQSARRPQSVPDRRIPPAANPGGPAVAVNPDDPIAVHRVLYVRLFGGVE